MAAVRCSLVARGDGLATDVDLDRLAHRLRYGLACIEPCGDVTTNGAFDQRKHLFARAANGGAPGQVGHPGAVAVGAAFEDAR